MSDIDKARQAFGLSPEKEEIFPLLDPKPTEPPAPIPINPQPIDPAREAFGLSTSPAYALAKGFEPSAADLDDPNVSLMRFLAASDDPMAEIGKINAARYIADSLDIDPAVAYHDIDNLSEYWMGKVVPPEAFVKSLRTALG
ncbi:MAG TPA: hypothetical protein ENI27_05840, partial [bacterium]|nr:hypothetical protein [bacterium]